MDWKKMLTEQGMKLMQDPRVTKLMQDPRVMKAMMQAFQARGKVQESFEQTVANTAKTLGLVTKSEVKKLERSMRKMERDLKKAQKKAEDAEAALKAHEEAHQGSDEVAEDDLAN